MIYGLTGQIISIVMSFIVRTVFIYTLGIEYLGVEGLFSSILLMLSLANLGFDTAMIYSMYKPLADKDKYKIQALMNLYKKAYRLIGFVVFIIGLAIVPILPNLMNGTTSVEHINIIYMLFLLNSASSYYFVYKQSIIIADQKNYIISKVHTKFVIISNVIQVILLISTRNYIVVLIIQILFRIIENIYLAKKANDLYPFLKVKNKAKLTNEEKKDFFENLYSLLLYKISGVVINGTDNIIIAAFLGIAIVGIYSNYLLILMTLSTLLSYIFYSVTASVGNLHVTESTEKKYFIFRVIHFLNFWTYGFCVICLWNLLNPFITLWLGEAYVFDKLIVLCILFNFLTAGMQNASTIYRETTGLFKKGKYRPIIAAVINIVASLLLVNNLGLAGVFLGTVFSRLCTYFWFDPYVIFKYLFQRSVQSYFKNYIFYFLLIIAIAYLTDLLGSYILVHNPMLNFIFRGILCLIVPNLVFFILFRRSEELKYVLNLMKKMIPINVNRRKGLSS
ncbi:O-antigen/teichoic acid export membrane protein [Cytobacillus purgationiresistens]|uniref:O-antigen/teichoic acid export membrane protein n=2 Tax=Cytobacillus purgationiresistens TaxID=863449 RepID=A0ABU0AI59_9BACI|nr:O-antigen/teichoic acid export membrane protein [Cytobacillus purgationiresistens]